MAANWGVDVLDGKKWYVGAQTVYRETPYPNTATPSHGEIIIPVCQLDNLTTEQIGETVLGMRSLANACYAEDLADSYIGRGGLDWQSYFRRGADGEELQQMLHEDLPLLEQYLDNEYLNQARVSEVVFFLRELKRTEQQRAEKQSRPRKTHPARKVINNSYNSIFMRIGRRDGFHCGACRATTALEIDHIVPVVGGGGSEDGNLQLLCGSCNSSKGTKTMDYRMTSPNEKTQLPSEPDIHAQQPTVTQGMPGVSC